MCGAKLLEIKNDVIGAVSAGSNMPLGKVILNTSKKPCGNTFNVTTSGADTVEIGEAGYYMITYNASLIAAAATTVNLLLDVNGEDVYGIGETASAIGDTVNLTLVYIIKVNPPYAGINALPATVNVQLNTTAITGGTSNMQISKIVQW